MLVDRDLWYVLSPSYSIIHIKIGLLTITTCSEQLGHRTLMT